MIITGDVIINHRKIRILPTSCEGGRLDDNSLINTVLWNRGVRSLEDIDYSLERLLPADNLKQLPQALEILSEALSKQRKVVVVGDFDSDGMTSTALAVLALQDFGLKEVNYFIPNRFEHGYGLTAKAVSIVLERFAPDLIITVDNGIVNYDGVQLAKEAGVQVLITDHHLAGAMLPKADAVIDPNQPEDGFASKHLTGVGVILYLMVALRKKLRDDDWFKQNGVPEPNLAQYLDLVAIGTMADAAVMDFNNRILVREGIKRIRAGRTRLGILALLESAKRDFRQLCSEDLTFVIAPRLNAAGRLSDAEIVVKLLTTVNKPRAQMLAAQLEELNNERKRISLEMEEQAYEMADELLRKSGTLSRAPAIVLYNERWHQGINGIVASRIKERFVAPVFIFSNGNDGCLKGSARSIEGLDIKASFDRLAQLDPDLIDGFGGHAMAAGISIRPQNLAAFTYAWQQVVQDMLKGLGQRYIEALEVDAFLEDTQYLNLETARKIRQLGPWGSGFTEPSFYGRFLVEWVDKIGDSHLRLKVKLLEHDQVFEATLFNSTKEQRMTLQPQAVVEAVFRLSVNSYGGCDRLQLTVVEAQKCEQISA